ncbi:hypothetical protein CYMTET_49358 [Cymbomonas tetramitiformis]|uniref:Uncharacterized protein n=1 Tax=Cymbomonas tetramitiformis TaxID=36881 RepID=A0AAE0EUT1_9CHLO|nr:hypothetical protein CYMTET_49358 [Cymbomonas tetramitiformis]
MVEERGPVAHGLLLGTDAESDRNGRRASIDIIKGCVPLGVRQTLQAEHSLLRYPAKADPRPLLAKKQKLVHNNRVPDWCPTEATRKQQLCGARDPDCKICRRSSSLPDAIRLERQSPDAITLKLLVNLMTSIYVAWQQ